jgi:L-ribulose-5-phosphate 3-epimerase
MEIVGHVIGVCSWSLHPKDANDLVAQLRRLGLSHAQLALGPLLAMDDERRETELRVLRDGGLQFTAGMIGFPGEDYSSIAIIKQTGGFVPDESWMQRRELSFRAAELAQGLGLKQVSTHIGFIPQSNDSKYVTMVERVSEVAEKFATAGLELGMETGQEPASELLQFLNDLRARNVFVNFDPANMILYGAGDPFDAIRTLGRHIRHVHVKDATPSAQPGTVWGAEVPFGMGDVIPSEFVAALHDVDYRGPLVIEREAGADRVADVELAIENLRAALG